MPLPEVEEFFAGISGRECWSIIGGAGSGSVVSLRFGEKVRAQRAVRNPALSLEERLFEGERSLIIYCDWRLEQESRILSSSQSTTDQGDLDLEFLLALKNVTVKEIGFSSPVHDLRIAFENGFVLSVFCDVPLGDDANYVMFNPTNCIAVTTDGGLTVESR